jgi:hypothetical protein
MRSGLEREGSLLSQAQVSTLLEAPGPVWLASYWAPTMRRRSARV